MFPGKMTLNNPHLVYPSLRHSQMQLIIPKIIIAIEAIQMVKKENKNHRHCRSSGDLSYPSYPQICFRHF